MPLPTHVVTVLTPDRPGIINALVETLAAREVAYLGVSQTVVEGAFTIALTLSMTPEQHPEAVRDALLAALDESASASLLALDPSRATPAARPRYVLTAIGDDRSGVVREITRLVLEHGGTFSDFASEVVDGRLQLLAEVELPGSGAPVRLQEALQGAAETPGLTVRLQHPRLFSATNEIAFRRSAS